MFFFDQKMQTILSRVFRWGKRMNIRGQKPFFRQIIAHPLVKRQWQESPFCFIFVGPAARLKVRSLRRSGGSKGTYKITFCRSAVGAGVWGWRLVGTTWRPVDTRRRCLTLPPSRNTISGPIELSPASSGLVKFSSGKLG